MISGNPWDLLSDYFDTSKNAQEIPSGAADNIFVAWPVFLQFIQTYSLSNKNQKVLDYGCGGGSFANKLRQLSFQVIGIDSSEDMIQIAKKSYGEDIKFYKGNITLLRTLNEFNIITSIMTLQFIKDIEKTISAFSQSILTNGLLIFAVHNPDFVKEGIKNDEYEKFDSKINPKQITLQFENDVKIPIYIRTAEEYNALAKKYQLKPLLEDYPSFTQNFIEKYPEHAGYTNSEYLILGYKKE